MNSWRAFKYYSPLIIYAGAFRSFSSHGLICYLPVIYAFGLIPLLELLIRPNTANREKAEEEMAKVNRLYDFVLYAIVLLQWPALIYYLRSMTEPDLRLLDKLGRTVSMGLLCGTFGINVGHELGHRSHKLEQGMAKLLLLSSLYMHFFIEHNKGHHKNVATPADPSSARLQEPLYLFWCRTIFFSYLSAWKIAARDCRRRQRAVAGIYNEMLQFQLIQLLFVAFVWFFFGLSVLLWYLGSALMGILLLETVNYIEHYGLSRHSTREGQYERTMPWHSWNSDHVIGRLMLFELSRHSDHHYLASRKYQILRHHSQSPQMPTGYPGMMLLALVPPLWFRVMNPRARKAREMAG